MAFPASQGILSDVLERASKRALHIKTRAQAVRDRSAATGLAANEVIDLDTELLRSKAELESYASTPGIGAYAQEQFDDPTLDVAAEWSAMISAIEDVSAWVRTNFPTDGGGWLLARQWGAGGPSWRQFTTGQTAGLRTELDALIATIS